MSKTVTILRVTNHAHQGYRRAGVTFDLGINELPATTFNATQRALLATDPHLTVDVLPAEPAVSEPQTSVATRAGRGRSA